MQQIRLWSAVVPVPGRSPLVSPPRGLRPPEPRPWRVARAQRAHGRSLPPFPVLLRHRPRERDGSGNPALPGRSLLLSPPRSHRPPRDRAPSGNLLPRSASRRRSCQYRARDSRAWRAQVVPCARPDPHRPPEGSAPPPDRRRHIGGQPPPAATRVFLVARLPPTAAARLSLAAWPARLRE